MDELQTKLHSMWTPDMFDRFEANLRALMEASPEYTNRPEEREKMIAALKKKANRPYYEPKVKITEEMK